MKAFFSKIKTWFIAHKPSKRRLIQVYTALLYNANIKGFIKGNIYTGGTKNVCVPGLNCYSCPGAIGACPLGALQNALGESDTKAPYYVIGIIALFGLIFARTVCGFLCPVGLGQELLYKIKTPKLKKNRVTRVLSYLKYVFLAVLVILLPIILGAGFPTFCKYICPAGTFGGGVGLLANPENADLYAMLSGLFTWKFALLVLIIVLSIFIFRFFCRFICPLGAIYGFFNRIALIGVSLDKSKCTDCGLCVNHCKMDIKHVGDQECIECGECISVCPTQAITWKGSKIFLHANAIEAAEAAEEAAPLTSLLQSGTSVDTAEETVITEETLNISEEEVKEANKPLKSSAQERIRKRNKWLEIAAWALAGVFLICVLVYYNFFAPADAPVKVNRGEPCPTFTARTYDGTEEGGTFSLEDAGGKVVVINFWYTTCGPCITELPHFNTLQENYADDVIVVALHRTLSVGHEDVQTWINNRTDAGTGKNWSDYSVIFAQDTDTIVEVEGEGTTLFRALGGKQAFPMTIVVDGEGKISYTRQGGMPYEELEKAVLEAKR